MFIDGVVTRQEELGTHLDGEQLVQTLLRREASLRPDDEVDLVEVGARSEQLLHEQFADEARSACHEDGFVREERRHVRVFVRTKVHPSGDDLLAAKKHLLRCNDRSLLVKENNVRSIVN